MAVVNVFCWFMVLIIGLPIVFVIFQCLLGAVAATPRRALFAERPCLGVLVPAHNEEQALAATLTALLVQLRPGDRLLVIADNCSDATPQIARRAGAEVVERNDPLRRGKGYALAAGMEYFSADPPAVILVVDADCTLSHGSVDHLVRQVQGTGKPAQAIYLMRPPSQQVALATVSTFAFLVKNEARPRGLARLGQPVLLTGTGMAFPWSVLSESHLATDDIVEDLALSLELIAKGQGPLLCPEARVESKLPLSKQAAATQRTRWEHGYLRTLCRQTPRLLIKGILRLKPQLVLAGLELSVPPLSLLVALAMVTTVFTLFSALITGYWGPAIVAASLLVLLSLVFFLVWFRFGRGLLAFRAFLDIPHYMLWKLPIYFKFITQRQTTWIRTERYK